MDTAGILIAIAAISIVVFTIAYNLVRAKKGKSSCGNCTGKNNGTCTGCTKYKEND